MMPKLRIAVIGVGANHGSRARQYIETITRLTEHYELVAICDRNPQGASGGSDPIQGPSLLRKCGCPF